MCWSRRATPPSATSFTTPVAGTYRVETSLDGLAPAEYVLSAEHAATAFPLASDLVISENSVTTVGGSWTPPAAAKSYFAFISSGEDPEAFQGRHLTETTIEFTGLDLIAGAAYNFDVISYPNDQTRVPEYIEPYALSLASSSFSPPLSAGACSDTASVVSIPDPNLTAAIIGALPDPAPEEVTCGDLELLTVLDAPNAGIANLEGLQFATNLTDLRLGGNDVTSVLPLAGLASLEILILSGNQISNISPLAGLTNLFALLVSDNPIDSIDAAAGMTKLEYFGAARTEIQSIDVLSDKSALWYIGLNGARSLTDFSPLTALDALTDLLVGDTLFGNDDMAMLADKPGLKRLQIWGNPHIDDLSALAGLDLTTELDIGGTGVDDISQIHHLTGLARLWMYGLGLTNGDIGFLTTFTELNSLNLSWNQLTDLSTLVDMVNLGILSDGDAVYLEGNPLDLDDPTTSAQLQSMVDAGVTVEIGD
jgi:Leucine-rich repeat (LRR) protein